MDNLVFGLAIKDRDGKAIYGPNTKETREKIVLKKGNHFITITINDNFISPGVYVLEAGIFNDSQTVCHDYVSIKNAITFVGLERHGYVYTQPEWTIE